MEQTIKGQRLYIAATVVLLLAALVVIGRPAIGGAQEPSPPRIHVQHTSDRLLDTRELDAKPGDGWSTKVQLPGYAVNAIDWEVNVQVVQADGDGWIEVAGKSAVVHDGGRANNALSVSPESGGQLNVRVHGGGAHVIVDLIKIVTEQHDTTESPSTGEAGT